MTSISSPYAVLRAEARFAESIPRGAWEAGGRPALDDALRDLLRRDAGRRASSPAEVVLLRAWVEDELPRAVDHWLGESGGRGQTSLTQKSKESSSRSS